MSSERAGAFARRRSAARPLAIAAAALLLSGCGGDGGKAEKGTKALMLYCGAGLRPAVAEVAEAFEKERSARIECDYGASEILLSRVKLAKRGDLYMPGDKHYVDLADKEGLVLSQRTACYLVPVILVRKGNPKGIKGLRDLLAPGVKVGLGEAKTCAIGRTTVEILKKNGVPEAEMEKNVSFRSVTVNELGVHIKTGSLDAAIVWDGVAAQYADCGDAVRIPRDRNVISTVTAGVLNSTENRELADAFVEFACSEKGKAFFRKHGYTVTEPE